MRGLASRPWWQLTAAPLWGFVIGGLGTAVGIAVLVTLGSPPAWWQVVVAVFWLVVGPGFLASAIAQTLRERRLARSPGPPPAPLPAFVPVPVRPARPRSAVGAGPEDEPRTVSHRRTGPGRPDGPADVRDRDGDPAGTTSTIGRVGGRFDPDDATVTRPTGGPPPAGRAGRRSEDGGRGGSRSGRPDAVPARVVLARETGDRPDRPDPTRERTASPPAGPSWSPARPAGSPPDEEDGPSPAAPYLSDPVPSPTVSPSGPFRTPPDPQDRSATTTGSTLSFGAAGAGPIRPADRPARAPEPDPLFGPVPSTDDLTAGPAGGRRRAPEPRSELPPRDPAPPSPGAPDGAVPRPRHAGPGPSEPSTGPRHGAPGAGPAGTNGHGGPNGHAGTNGSLGATGHAGPSGSGTNDSAAPVAQPTRAGRTTDPVVGAGRHGAPGSAPDPRDGTDRPRRHGAPETGEQPVARHRTP